MITRYDVCLDGISLAHLDPDIAVLDIQQEPGQISTQALSLINGHGYITGRSKDQPRITVTFEIHTYDITRRQAIMQMITAWAMAGGYLTASDRPGQRIRVVCDQLPAYGVKAWTGALQIVFEAYSLPYWEDAYSTVITATNQTKSAHVPGNAPRMLARAKVDVTVTANAALTGFMVTTGDTRIALNGLSLSSGSKVVFSHDENGILSIMQGSTSLLPKRSTASSDDLLVECGRNNNFRINANATAVFEVRGLWL